MIPNRRIVKFKSSKPVVAAVEPKRIISHQLNAQLTPVQAVAATIEIKARNKRLYAFEEKGNPDARLTPPDPLEDTEDQYKLKTTSDTPFLDIFLGRKFQITTESVTQSRGGKSQKPTKSNKTSRKKGTAARLDYFMLKLLLRAICPNQIIVPDIVSDNKSEAGTQLKYLIENAAAKYTVNRLLKVSKNLEAKNFRIELPIITADFGQFAHTLGYLIAGGKPVIDPETGEPGSTYINTRISDDPTDKLLLTLPDVISIPIGKMGFPTKGMDVEELNYLAKANASIVIHPIKLGPPRPVAPGTEVVDTNEPNYGIYAALAIDCSRKEAEYITKTPFSEIRALDIYSMLLNWAAPAGPKNSHRYDSSTSARFSVPLSRMASLLPKDSGDLVRTNEDGICITVDGEFLALPASVDNTNYYETTYQNYLGDETTAQINTPQDYALGNKKAAAIKSLPILLDWQNCKFSYTDTSGALAVLDLDNSYKATTTHYIRFLRSSCMEQGTKAYSFVRELEIYADIAGLKPEMFGAPPKITEHISLMANRLGYYNADDASKTPLLVIPYTARPYKEVSSREEFESDNGIFDPFDNQLHEEKEIPEGGFKTAAPNANSQGIMNLASTLLQKMTENPELFYGKRGVISAAGMVALLKIFLKGADFPELVRKNIKEKEKYTKQGKDPNYKTDALPLISTDGNGISPQFHQEEILNLLRDSPENAAIPAAAGAGKTIIAILDILRQIDKGDTGPFVIACPAELVADYTKEISYATAGKLNPICITTDVWNRHQIDVKDGLLNIIRKAPRNTVLVVAYRTLSLKAYEVVYGTEKVTIYPVLELIRSFRPTYGFFDECHKLKNPSGLQHKAAARLIAGLRTKRIASGTMVANTLVDIAAQIKLIDPTIFGSQAQFAEKYMTMINGKLAPKPGAEQAAKNLIFSSMVIAGADRKKWAYKLPRAQREFIPVKLTPLQQVTHDYLLKTAFEEMSGDSALDDGTEEISETGQALKDSADKYQNSIAQAITEANHNLSEGLAVLHENARFQGGDKSKDIKQVIDEASKEAAKNDYNVDVLDAADAIDKDEDDEDEDSTSGDLELSGYLTQLEGFINDPSTYEELMWRVSELTDVPFTNIDLYSPKVAACISRIKKHLDENIPGKIIVFCNYNNTREAIVRALPPEIRSQTINYLASQKLSMRHQFETDPKMKVMIGIEKSLSTGFNFQNASRLIRIETVWSPSDVEQGDSRINRPNVKAKEVRDAIYYDTIVADDTVDITKSSYLVAKLVSQIKFDQTEAVSMEDRVAVSKQGTANPFMLLDNPPPFRLSPKNIMENSSIQHMSTTYLSVLNKTNNLLRRSYAQYALDHKNELFENPEVIQEDKTNVHLTKFPLTLVQKVTKIAEKPAPDDCALMYRIPYAAGMNIYGSDALGLIPYRQWLEFKKFDVFVTKQGYNIIFAAPEGVARNSPEYKAAVTRHGKQIADLEKEFVKLHQPVVHTAFGDGVCKNSSGVNLWVYTEDNTKLLVPKSTCFVVNRAYTNNEDLRMSLLKQAKLRIQDAVVKDLGAVPKKQLISDEDTKAKKVSTVAPAATTQPAAQTEDKLALSVMTINGFPYIRVDDQLIGRTGSGKLMVKPLAKDLMTNYKFSNFSGSPEAVTSLFLINTPSGKDLLRVISFWEKNGFRVVKPLRSKLLELTTHVAGASDLVDKLEAMQIPMLTFDVVKTLRAVKDSKNAAGSKLITPFPYVINGVTLGIVLAPASNNVEAIEAFKASNMASTLKGTVLSGYGLRSQPTLEETDLVETLEEFVNDTYISETTAKSLTQKLLKLQTRTTEGSFAFDYKSSVELGNQPAAKPPVPAKPAQAPAEKKPVVPAQSKKPVIAPSIRIVNNIASIRVAAESKEEISLLESMGFQLDNQMRSVRVLTPSEVSKVMTTILKTPGVEIPPANRTAMLSLFSTWKKHRAIDDLEVLVPTIHTELEIDRQIHMRPVNPTANENGERYPAGTKFIFITPVVTDKSVSLSVPVSHADSVRLFTELVVPNVVQGKVYRSQEGVYSYYAKSKADLGNKFKELLGVAELENKQDLINEFKSLRITPKQA
jgi:superfamily II DNA or RNA helicase